MTDDFGSAGDTGAVDPSGVPSEWQPPSTMPAVPPVAPTAPPNSPLTPPTSPLTPPVASVSTGVIVAEEARGPRWLGRGFAVAAAAVLLGGGGYLAINAGADDGGGDSPRRALDGVLAAIANEDLIGAAEFVEPSERATLIDTGFEVVEELIRLEVFDDSLDLSAVDGFDFEFDDIEISVVEIRPGMAHLFIESGTASAAIDGEAIPLGPLVTDRVEADDLAISESTTEEISRNEFPIVALERNGRWYLSLWYSVAENALLETGTSRPGVSQRLAEIGADTPERAVENFMGALEHLDLATMIGMLDPQEASALYDYAPAFIDDAQNEADRFLDDMRLEGWFWEIVDLRLSADTDGSLSTVFIDALAFEASGPDSSLDVSFSPGRMDLSFVSPDLVLDYTVEGDCFTLTYEDDYERDTQTMCTDELLADAGLSTLNMGAFGGLNSVDEVGLVVRNVAGRWYISPVRTGSRMTLEAMRTLDAEALADTVDSFIGFFEDPFALADSFGDDFATTEDFTPVPTTTFGVDEQFPPYTEENRHLLAPGLDVHFVFDLVEGYRAQVWWRWLSEAEEREYGDGVRAQLADVEHRFVDLVVLDDLVFDSDEALAEWLGGELLNEGDFTYLALTNEWDDDIIAARSDNGIAFIATHDGFGADEVAALRTQVGR